IAWRIRISDGRGWRSRIRQGQGRAAGSDPDGPGFADCRWLGINPPAQSDAPPRHIPLIALTAHALAGSREQALAAGCDEFDTKPINFERLMQKVDFLLGSSRATG